MFSLYTNSGGPSESPLREKVLSEYPKRGTYLKPWDMSKHAFPTMTDYYQGLSGVWGTSVKVTIDRQECVKKWFFEELIRRQKRGRAIIFVL